MTSKKIAAVLISTLLILNSQSISLAQNEPSYVPNQVLVLLNEAPSLTGQQPMAAGQFGSLSAGISSILTSVNAKSVRRVFRPASSAPPVSAAQYRSVDFVRRAALLNRQDRTVLVELESSMSVENAIDVLLDNPSVEYAEPNYYVRPFATPNDTLYSDLWGMRNTGQAGSKDSFDPATGTSGSDIDAETAWDATKGAASTVVAVIDTGLDWDHPDIASNVWSNTDETDGNSIDDDGNGRVDDVRGWDFANNDNNPDDDCNNASPAADAGGHGTHVSGTVGAVGNNSTGVAGVAWTVSIMPLKVALTGSCLISNASLADAISYASDNGAHIINMSLGGPASSTVETAVNAADSNGVVLIAAAGNDSTSSTTNSYPAAYSNVVGVVATDRNDQRASFSNYGTWVSVSAPGVAIRSTLPVADGSYGYLSGTSMASPMTAGLAALIKSQNSSLTAAQIVTKIINSGEDIDSLNAGFSGLLGAGRINAARALMALTSVSPALGVNTQAISITVTGVSIPSDATLKLTRSGETDITATGVTIPNSTTISGTVNIAGAAKGAWSVVVTAGNSVQTLSDAFTVETLTVSSVSPFRVENTGPSGTIQVTGTNFSAGMTFRLTRSGQTAIPGTSVNVVSATQATFQFDATNADGGRWNFVVTRDGNDLTFSDLFAIASDTFDVFDTDPNSDVTYQFSNPTELATVHWPAGAVGSTSLRLDVDADPSLPSLNTTVDAYAATNRGIEITPDVSNPTFAKPFTLILKYTPSSLPDPNKEDALSIAVYNTTTGRWEPIVSRVDTVNKRVSADIQHLSTFQILQHAPASSLNNVVAFPNPFRSDLGHTRVLFDFLTAGARVRLYDTSGALVQDLTDSNEDGLVQWNLDNESGEDVASGIYFYLVTDPSGNKETGRVGVVR